MKTKPSLWLMLLLLMFPQIVETLYSPALASISQAFAVSDARAAQTLSIYFIAFALGVAVWGIVADLWGRRPTMLLGLGIYGLAALVAMQTDSFGVLMLARACSAFGIAVGSIVTQTMLRDSFDGGSLGKVFSLMGLGIALSPVIGMFTGGQLVQLGGHGAVFSLLFIMAWVLLGCCVRFLPETLPETATRIQGAKQSFPLSALAKRMLADWHIWRSALLVAIYNIGLFSYYQLGGFAFARLGLTPEQFGYSGLLLGLGSCVGSYLNSRLIANEVGLQRRLVVAATLLLLGAASLFLLQGNVWFVLPMCLVVMAFGVAIPNVLSMALSDYKLYAGSAGALLGLLYYLLIGAGLALAGVVEHLGWVLLGCAVAAWVVTLIHRR
ncbi:MFS transporter [Shewanella sp. 3B26]|uniref:MFS transporter n=1 Tax=Shewanella zhuhaiensis TaxID=2919576 RepID=A0AAJ1BIH0_9GAMM|nr:MFS transporter [Shewanella zhuhaiensis]MCH4295363.1 MFS transporter [Shewanella zhuhaiensis]